MLIPWKAVCCLCGCLHLCVPIPFSFLLHSDFSVILYLDKSAVSGLAPLSAYVVISGTSRINFFSPRYRTNGQPSTDTTKGHLGEPMRFSSLFSVFVFSPEYGQTIQNKKQRKECCKTNSSRKLETWSPRYSLQAVQQFGDSLFRLAQAMWTSSR